jgi:hypothetical protein
MMNNIFGSLQLVAPSPSPPILSIQLEYLEDNYIQLTVTKEVER